MKIFLLDRSSIVEDYNDLSVIEGLQEGKNFNFIASRHEYFIVQLLLLPEYSSDKLEVSVGTLISGNGEYIGAVTCLNTEGVTYDGHAYKKPLCIKKDKLLPLFLGFDFSHSDVGPHSVKIQIGKDLVTLNIDLNDSLIFNEGADDKSSLSRLKWLNSNLERNFSLVSNLEALDFLSEKEIGFCGKRVEFGNDGMIQNMFSYFNQSNSIEEDVQANLFYKPMELYLEGRKIKYGKVRIAGRQDAGLLVAEGRGDNVRVNVVADCRYEGALNYKIKITAEKDFVTSNISLRMFFKDPQFLVGLGNRACRPLNIVKAWDSIKNQNQVYVGDVNCGARVKFVGKEEQSSVVGFYNQHPIDVPTGWFNWGEGVLKLEKTPEGLKLEASTGRVILPQGMSTELAFQVHLTPFKPINLKQSLSLRVGRDQIEKTYKKMIERASLDKVSYLNITYGGELNPYLNYPFPYTKALATLSKMSHKKKMGLSVSYNLREISVQNREIFAFKAFCNELLLSSDKMKDTDIKLSETMGQDVLLDKAVRYTSGARKGLVDNAVVVTPQSRLDNYFVEGVKYLVENAGIDAIAMRDSSLSRITAERVKKVLDKKKGLPGIIEMQISDQFNEKSGFSNSLNYYTDVLPFIDKVWFDRTFENLPQDPYITLAEGSGLLYGLAAAGMENDSIPKCLLYAMLPKYGLVYSTSDALGQLYKHLDSFKIENASYRGFWDVNNPFRTDKKEVLCSSFQNRENMLVVVYNFSDDTVEYEIGVETKFGFTTNNKKVQTLDIVGLQKKKNINLGKTFKLKGKTGMIFVVTEKNRNLK